MLSDHNEMKLKINNRKIPGNSLKTWRLNNILRDFPGGPVVKNLPYNAGDLGSIPGQRTKIPHATGQLSPRTTTTELTHLN